MLLYIYIYLRLVLGGAEPPMPSVEDEKVGLKPLFACLNGIQVQNFCFIFSDYVHQEWCSIVHHCHIVGTSNVIEEMATPSPEDISMPFGAAECSMHSNDCH
ncbi:hypothetical protein DsansV1_C20g0163721 [Dioscorea sansibarensis]